MQHVAYMWQRLCSYANKFVFICVGECVCLRGYEYFPPGCTCVSLHKHYSMYSLGCSESFTNKLHLRSVGAQILVDVVCQLRTTHRFLCFMGAIIGVIMHFRVFLYLCCVFVFNIQTQFLVFCQPEEKIYVLYIAFSF